MQNIIWGVLILAFVIDVLRRMSVGHENSSITKQEDILSNNVASEKINELDIEPEINQKMKIKIEGTDSEQNISYNLENESISPKKSEEKNIVLNVKYCTSWSYNKYFEDFRKIIFSKFSNVDVFGQEYPIGPIRSFLSKSVYFVQFSLIIISIIGQSITNYVNFIPQELITKLTENKMYVFGGFIFINMMQNMITSTGAFEIYVNDKLIWSKIQTGQIPDVNMMIDLIRQIGGQFA